MTVYSHCLVFAFGKSFVFDEFETISAARPDNVSILYVVVVVVVVFVFFVFTLVSLFCTIVKKKTDIKK